MRKFKPLDLSFIAAAGSPERESFRNVAAMINANAGWSQPSNAMLAEFKKIQDAEKSEAAKHKPSFISGFFDLLSTPLYGLANSLDESIAGHQRDNNDSVLKDAGEMYAGSMTGMYRGLKAGLRGASSMLDALPGVDISDEWQMNPEDKTRIGDVNVRLTSKMGTKEAMKPENWEKVKQNVAKEKSELDAIPGIRDFFYSDLDSPTAREDYFQRMKLLGLGEDILGDPLNYLTLGGKSAISAPKAAIEGLDAARANKGAEAITAGLITGSGRGKKGGDKFATPIKGEPVPEIPAGIIPESAPAVPGAPASLQPNIASSLIPKETAYKSLSQIGGRTSAPKGGFAIDPKSQKKLVTDIAKLAQTGRPDWIYRAADLLQKHPGVDFVNTTRFLDMANKMGKAKGPNFRHNAGAMATTLAARVAEDATKFTPAERILNTANPIDIVMAPAKKAKLRPQQARVANDVVRQFAPQILGKAKAPGTGERLAAKQAAGVNARWSGPQQVRMWNQLTTKFSMLPPKARYDVSAKVLQHIEDYFISKGVIPYSAAKVADSVEGLRLSQIAMALGPKTLADNPKLVTRILRGDEDALKSLTAEQIQAIEALKASEAMASAPAVKEGIGAGKNVAAEIMSKVQSAGRTKDELRAAIKAGESAAAAAGGGPVAAKVTGDYLRNLIHNPGGLNSIYSSNHLKTTGWLASSARGIRNTPVDKEFLLHVTRALYQSAQLPPPAVLGGMAGANARVREGFGALFNAAYGVKDMRHIFLRNQASALSTSARRAKYFNDLAKIYPPSEVDLWHEAFRAAQANGITTGRVSKLQAKVSKTMEDLFGGTGLKAGAIADSTVVGRSRLAMDELNESLKRFGLGEYQFQNGKKAKDALGNKRDFSKGADWLKSWEIWDVKKPYDFLHKVQQAIEHSVRQKSMFDEIAARFGSPNKHKGVAYSIDHPRLRGFFFTKEAAEQGQQFLKILKEVNTPSPKALQHIDHVVSKIKAALTIYIPSHHWTNIIGDVMFNWMAGVNNPRRYDQAVKIIRSQGGRYGDLAAFQKGIAGPDALKQAMLRGHIGTEALTGAGLSPHAAGNAVITTMRNGQNVTADMIYAAAMKEGILPSAKVLEEVVSETTNILDKIHLPGAAKGVVQGKVHQISEWRDHVPRLAQFIDGIAKSGGSFSSAVEHSAANVRKWHPDGLDLTKFERQVMKRVFPFYSWTRKAIPLAIESAMVAAPKTMAYPRLMEALSTSMGIEGEGGGTAGMFPTDQMFPDWIRERGIGPVAGGPGSYLTVNPSTPVLDIFTMLGKPGGTTLDMLNPLVKVPTELAQGATLGKQVPIENQADYLARQIPGISHAGRVSGYYGTSKSVAESDEQRVLNLINMMTGAKATQTGIYQKSAQFDLRDYLTQKAKAAREQ
jgi:hypothetical protein